MKQSLCIKISVIFVLTGLKLSAQDSLRSDNYWLSLNASYTSEFVKNISGGIKNGTCYLGQINLSSSFKTDNANLWKGGEFYVQLQNSHGARPSTSLVGDFQTLSNIENGNYTYLYELKYRQDFSKFWITLGIIDLNSEFIVSHEGRQFINSAFGVIPSVSGNIPLSIFPKNSLGIMSCYSFNENLSFQIATIDGNPESLDNDPHNLKHQLRRDEGYYYSGELLINSGKSLYKLCGYYHTGRFVDVIDSTQLLHNNYGLYFIADQHLFESSSGKRVTAFLQLGYAPTNRNYLDFYVGSGVVLYSPFHRKKDIMGIAVAHASICNDYYKIYKELFNSFETAIEMNYHLFVNDKLMLQPTIQYIINPGIAKDLDNALVASLRITFSL